MSYPLCVPQYDFSFKAHDDVIDVRCASPCCEGDSLEEAQTATLRVRLSTITKNNLAPCSLSSS